MRELTEIRSLLDRLQEVEADALETQDLDFKEWPSEAKQAIKRVFDVLGIERMRTSSGALREGVIYDLMGRLSHEDVRERTVNALMQRYAVLASHPQGQVAEVRRALNAMAFSAALRAAGLAAIPVGMWWLIGARRRGDAVAPAGDGRRTQVWVPSVTGANCQRKLSSKICVS